MTRLSIFFSLSIMLSILSCNSNSELNDNSFTVSGNVNGLDTEFMVTSYKDSTGNRVTDSVFVTDDSFSYTAEIETPTHIIFWPNVERTIKRSGRGYYPAKSSQFSFLASPGDLITFEGEVKDFINAYPSGTEANDDLARINRTIFPLLNESVNTLLRQEKLAETDSVKILELEDSIKSLEDQVLQLKKEFVSSNPGSEAAIWYLSDMMMRSQISDEEAIEFYNKVDEKLKTNPFYLEVASRVKGIESTLIGKTVPDFTTNNTLDDTEFVFSTLRGKHVLIDFWGTWCGPCIAEMPKIKEYQEKYDDQLFILGINSGDTKEKMEKFITEKNYTWKQVLAGEGNDNLVLKFNVSGFPTKFIIDPEGKILHRYVGDGEKAFTVLDELLEI